MSEAKGSVAVIGAGIVGAASALSLAMDGWTVTVIEPNDPGSGCSMGNAGHIGVTSVIPWSTPQNVRQSFKMLRNPLHPLKMPVNGWLENVGWMMRFLAAARPKNVAHEIRILNELCQYGWHTLDPLVKDADARELINDRGVFYVYASEGSFRGGHEHNELRRKLGRTIVELSGDELREMEPNLGPVVAKGVHLPEVYSVSHPQELARRFVRATLRRGGDEIREAVADIRMAEGNKVAVSFSGGERVFDKVVLSAGIGSRRFFPKLGVTVPMTAEYGYHLQMTGFSELLGRSVAFVDKRVVFSPMAEGMRLTSGAVFANSKGNLRYDLPRRIFESAKHLLPALRDLKGREWHDARPSTPDSLPIIGLSPKMENVIVATGHGHTGLGQSGVAGRIVTMLANGAIGASDLAAISPVRPMSLDAAQDTSMRPLRIGL